MRERINKKREVPIERGLNENIEDYMQRLYEATLVGADSIHDALVGNPTNFARMLNHLPELIEAARSRKT